MRPTEGEALGADWERRWSTGEVKVGERQRGDCVGVTDELLTLIEVLGRSDKAEWSVTTTRMKSPGLVASDALIVESMRA